MTRRDLLQAFGVVLRGVITLVLPACASRREPAGAGSSVRHQEIPSSTAKLPASEMENLVALAEVLVQGRPLSPFDRRALVEAINERALTEPGHLRLYRLTASFLDQLGQTRFADLSLAGQADQTRSYLDGLKGTLRPVRTVPVVLPDGQAVLRVEFTAPSPLQA